MKFLFGMLLKIATLIVKAFTMMLLWNWFIVTKFNCNSLNFIESISIFWLLNYLKYSLKKYKKIPNNKFDDKEFVEININRLFESVVTSCIVIVVSLGIKYFIN